MVHSSNNQEALPYWMNHYSNRKVSINATI